jgi:hypothetical protein
VVDDEVVLLALRVGEGEEAEPGVGSGAALLGAELLAVAHEADLIEAAVGLFEGQLDGGASRAGDEVADGGEGLAVDVEAIDADEDVADRNLRAVCGGARLDGADEDLVARADGLIVEDDTNPTDD